MTPDSTLLPSLLRLAQLQRQPVNRLALQEAVSSAQKTTTPSADAAALLQHITDHLGLSAARWMRQADPARMPALVYRIGAGWSVLLGRNASGQWVLQQWVAEENRWQEQSTSQLHGAALATVALAPAFRASTSPVLALIVTEIRQHHRLLALAGLGGLLIGSISLVASFYSMQIYDRVIPTSAMQTLLVLSLGAMLAAVLELLARKARSRLYEELIDTVDQRLSREVYLRLLGIRLDQFPRSVGSLASQMRGYETVRGFLTQATASVLVDLPFSLLFLGLIAVIGGTLVTVPLFFLVLASGLGVFSRKGMDELSRAGMAAGNFKTGLLVETVEGAETLKSGQGGWRMLSRWLKTTQESRDIDLQTRRITEDFQHLMGTLQQLSYIGMVAWGAYLVSRGALSMGSLVACSILAGRVLTPFSLIASQTLQWSQVKAALQGLDALWRLEDDHAGHEPVLVKRITGHYTIDNVHVSYADRTALQLPQLSIRAGERIGIIGPVGAGKTTLLRLLSGMYKPQQGRVLLDDIDLVHIAKPVLAEHVGYLQQDGRLFAGTLRENLLLGMIDPGDDAVLAAARRTGLLASVIAPHPQGLQQAIHEGGSGLSGGQRQLVNITRVLLRDPHIWLLDEPTSHVDGNTEALLLGLLRQCIEPGHTLVLVTHKPELLQLVDRVIVVANHQIVMDGPKAQVMAQLASPVGPANPARPAQTTEAA